MTKRLLTFLLTLVTCVVWLVPSVSPGGGVANAQTLANGFVVSGDFKGAGSSQIASLYDSGDNLGLRISVLDRAGATDQFTASVWYESAANTLDLGRMKVAATDVNFDGKTDLVALYDDGGTSVRILVWTSTGSGFSFTGTQGWWRSDSYAWSRTKAILAGNFSGAGHNGLLFIYQYDNFDMRIHYFESGAVRHHAGALRRRALQPAGRTGPDRLGLPVPELQDPRSRLHPDAERPAAAERMGRCLGVGRGDVRPVAHEDRRR